jgi:adenylyltransferase and sulfurtransferase
MTVSAQDNPDQTIALLQEEIKQLRLENERLKRGFQEPAELEASADQARRNYHVYTSVPPISPLPAVTKLSPHHVERYSRQILVSATNSSSSCSIQSWIGVSGQCSLLSSSVLVVGAGGIGSTVLLYLASCGIGRIGIVDPDTVEISNLHRQVIHRSCDVGTLKVVSAQRAIRELNPSIECLALAMALNHDNAVSLISQFDVVVDATDNPATRFLINDACILCDKPLVSGSALGTQGQITVYNYRGGRTKDNEPPCYRCLYPHAPVTHGACGSCSESGVLGPVPGLIGILQAMEVIKILVAQNRPETAADDGSQVLHDRLLMYDALQCSFHTLKKPKGNRSDCLACSGSKNGKSLIEASLSSLQGIRGPATAAAAAAPSVTLECEACHISCTDYNEHVLKANVPHVLLDVRDSIQFSLCALDHATNVPLAELVREIDRILELSLGPKGNSGAIAGTEGRSRHSPLPIYCICRRGVNSQRAVSILLGPVDSPVSTPSVYSIVGGYTAWRSEVDSTFPSY